MEGGVVTIVILGVVILIALAVFRKLLKIAFLIAIGILLYNMFAK